ncbi:MULTISPECIES: hypothetical protein [Pseudomonas]|jgi:hypothetical protein|uniref:hypothetical protein n=1 Tax=Pseudomonas TaxID=286 RepID=UPI0005FB7716|nr:MULTISPECIES: hypothetical protein [Pseudomonas]KJZ35636.1 hypothetical protein VC33_18245 [Pseudomonas fluorescens]OOG15083.1 hypothetical protein BMS17_24310 [Pseudomonas sp. C9]
MNFNTTVMPGVRAFALTMRVKPCRERTTANRAIAPYCAPSSQAKAHPRANWRVCPMTGRLVQRWNLDDSQEPPSRRYVRRSPRLNPSLGARSAH